MKRKIAFKIWEFIYFYYIHLFKRLSFGKQLYENKENLQVYVIVELGCSADYDGFEANFKSVV